MLIASDRYRKIRKINPKVFARSSFLRTPHKNNIIEIKHNYLLQTQKLIKPEEESRKKEQSRQKKQSR